MTTTIVDEDGIITVDTSNIYSLKKAMLFKANHIKAKAEPCLFEAVAKALDNAVVWHPYPQERPTKIRHKYIVSAYMGGELVTYEDFYGEYEGVMSFMLGCPVIAWAEFPRPYEVEQE